MKKDKCLTKKNRLKQHRSNHGFSMIELIIAIAIMALLAAALVPQLLKYLNKAKKSTDIQTAKTIGDCTLVALTELGDNYADRKVYHGSTLVDEEYDLPPGESFYEFNKTESDVTVDGETYRFVIVAYTSYVDSAGRIQPDTVNYKKHNGCVLKFRHGNNESKSFVEALNNYIGGSVTVKYRNKEMGGDFNRFFVGYRKDNPDQIEVWVGPEVRGDRGGCKIRLYPTPDSSYTDD